METMQLEIDMWQIGKSRHQQKVISTSLDIQNWS